MIIDTGSRREFETGAVRDNGGNKGRCDLLPLDIVAEMLHNPILASIAAYKDTGDPQHLEDALLRCAWTLFEDKPTMLLEVAIHYAEGAEKYGPDNWQKGIPTSSYVDSGVRHALKHLRGDTDERHDRALVWNLLAAWWTCKHLPELNSYAKEGKA